MIATTVESSSNKVSDTMPTYPTYKLGDICELLNGFAFKSSNYVQSGLRVIRITNVKKGYVIDEEPQFYPLETQEELKKYILKKGDLLISLTGNVGRVGILSEDLLPAALNQRVGCLRVKDKSLVSLQYLFHLLNTNSFEKDCINSSKGIAQKNMSTEWLKEYEITLPPLPTQHLIVSRIETLFAELDKAVQHLRTAQQQLKTYRQAVLNHWLNNEDGKWEMVKLGEVLQKIEAGKSFRCNEKVPALHEKGIVKISAVTWGEFLEDECKTIINEDLYNPQFAIHKGDLLISRANTIQLVGNCVLVRKEPKRNIMLSDKVLRLVISDNADSDFILYSLRTSKSRTQIQNMSTGNQDSMRNIGQDRIKKIEIPLPPLSDQQRIVNEIESRLSQATASETYIENALQQAEALRQSILKKAFSGELV